MPDPLEILQDLKDRVQSLPDQVAEMVRFELATPSRSGALADVGALAGQAIAGPVEDLMPQLESAGGGGDVLGGPQGGLSGSSPYDLPEAQRPVPGAGDFEPFAVEPPRPGGFEAASADGPTAVGDFEPGAVEAPSAWRLRAGRERDALIAGSRLGDSRRR